MGGSLVARHGGGSNTRHEPEKAMLRAVIRLMFLLITVAGASAEIPAPDLWTEANISGWSAGPLSKNRASVKTNTAQLVGQRAIELIAQPGDTPVTFSLNLGKAWDLSDADQLVLAWREIEGSAVGGDYPQVTLWAKNEIGEGSSRYAKLPINDKWQHIRLDLDKPDSVDGEYGAASRQGMQRIDFTLPPSARTVRILIDDLHFETSAALVLEQARKLGPLEEDIRVERYAKYLCGAHLKPAQRRILEAQYAPRTAPPETPHHAWGKPLADGPLRALFVVNMAFQREVIELAQRFDMTYDIVPLFMVQRYKPDLLSDLARKEYDVIVTSALWPDAQMQPFLDWLNLQVADGTGWIAITTGGAVGDIELPFAAIQAEEKVVDKWLIDKDQNSAAASHPILTGGPVELLPAIQSRRYEAANDDARILVYGESGGAKLGVATYGNGRIVNMCSGYGNGAFSILPTPAGDEHVKVEYPYWEYQYSLLAKAMIWAAGRTPAVAVTPAAASGGPTGSNRSEPSKAVFSVKTDATGHFVAAFQRTDGMRHVVGEVPMTIEGESAVLVPVPRGMPAGTHILELSFVDDDGRVVDWWRWPWTVEGDIAIDTVALDKDQYTHGDTIGVTTTIANTGDATTATLQYAVYDTWDRLIHRDASAVEIAAGTSTQHSSITVTDAFMTDAATLRLSVIDELGTAAVAFRRLYIPLAAEEKHKTWWVGATAGGSNMHPHIYPHLAERLRSFGINTIMTNSGYQPVQAELIVDSNLWVTPENIINTGRWHKRFPDGIRKPCLSDPQVLSDIRERTRTFTGAYRRFGAIGYASMEEHALCIASPGGTACLGPHCRNRFATHLQDMYGTLENLNGQWETQFESWDKVTGLRWEDGASDLKNPARWIDFRLFMEDVYAGMQQQFNEAVRDVDPEAYVGYNCGIYGESPFGGFNRTKMGSIGNFSVEYQPSWLEDKGMSTTMELLLDTVPGIKASYYTGYKFMDFAPERYWFKAWWMACRQQYGPFFYTVNNDASTIADYAYQKIHASLADNGFSNYAQEPLEALVQGVGKLLLTSRREVDIAVYHSQPSMMRRYFEAQRFPQDVQLPKWDVRKQLRELCHDYRRLSVGQLMAGDANRFKVLILANDVSLSAAEWQALETYMQQGGHVIGFARTGISDEHGTFNPDKHPEARVFGVKYPREALNWRTGRLQWKTATADVVAADPVVTAGAELMASFADGTPAISYKRHGAGGATYCNFSSNMALSDANLLCIRQVLEHAGIEAGPTVTRGGKLAGGFHVYRYNRGHIRYIALLQTMTSAHAEGTPMELVTGGPYYVYNVLEGGMTQSASGEPSTNTGDGDSVPFKALGRGRPSLFALMPYRVGGIALDFPQAVRAGEPCEFTVGIDSGDQVAGDHVLRIELFDPDDNIVEVHTRNVIAAGGQYRGEIPFAFNATPGVWRMSVRDVISGTVESRPLRLERSVPIN